ncbi:MAG: glycosyltransferase family 4 protein [Actinomycetia bacterium]|nr:glycosyltransferase family 4 protein [Actinomycetes bacterium]
MGDTQRADQPSSPDQRMAVTFLAPLPPPVTGQSQCDAAVLEHLTGRHTVEVLLTSKGELRQGAGSLAQLPTTVRQIRRILRAARQLRKSTGDVIYHSPSQTRIGNLKDLLLLAALGSRRSRVVFHLHGGGFGRTLVRDPPTRWLNRRLVGSIGAAIVLGPRLRHQVSDILPPGRVRVVANFADDELFCDPDDGGMNLDREPVEVLFLSSLFASKGWPSIVEAADILHRRGDERFRFVISGGAPTPEDGEAVAAAGQRLPNVEIAGHVEGADRVALLARAAVVAVPTTYPWEGQPMAILEAYAAGAVVLATDHAGIGDVFTSGENGYELPEPDGTSIVAALDRVVSDPKVAVAMARHNRAEAEKYRREQFVTNVEQILAGVANRAG